MCVSVFLMCDLCLGLIRGSCADVMIAILMPACIKTRSSLKDPEFKCSIKSWLLSDAMDG